MHANIVGHVSSIFPIACATGATDEKRSATAQMTDFILAGLRGNSLSGGRRGRLGAAPFERFSVYACSFSGARVSLAFVTA